MRHTATMKLGILISMAGLCPYLAAQHEPGAHGVAKHPAEMNKKFADPQMNIEGFVKRFESGPREVYVRRDEIARAVNLRPSESVADIGAGTGLFVRLFAERVGPGGTVYAVDISPAFLRHIERRAKEDGQDRVVKAVKNTQDSVGLPAGSIDVAFLCDTYHHFEHPGKMLASIRHALRPGGRLILVDFDLRPDSSKAVKQRARAPREVYIREIIAAGFDPIATPRAPSLKEQFFLEFRRAEVDRQGTSGTAPSPRAKTPPVKH
ncbi:MAG: methyltransferase domain-containing protein [Isosphaeraceae bacterium]